MFTSFARRLTGWYVVAAVTMVVVVLGAFGIVAMYLYVHLVQENIDADAREARAFSSRAAARGQTFTNAAVEFEGRMRRPGMRIVAIAPPARPPERREKNEPPTVPLLIKLAPAERRATADNPPPPPPMIVVDGNVMRADPRNASFEGSRFGFAIGTAFGAHFHRVPFLGGEMRLLPDPNAIGRIAAWLLVGIAALGALAGTLAWFTGRYITTQALRPLLEVTHALQRFAARDFTPQPIAVAGKSEFDAIALAYNAAAAQVAAAFTERQQAETQMRQFVADAGHELRTPLTIVLGYIDLLRRRADAGDERSKKIFSSIAVEGARMRTLIDNLVLLARMEGDDPRPTEPFEIGELLADVVDARKLLVPSLRVSLDLGVDATVIGNRDEIHEAFANIIDNAIKYAPGSPIDVVARAADGGVEVTITDHGPGIHPDDQAAIFDRFYRGAMRGDVEGSGLGLAIAKRAVERAGGTLILTPSTSEGATFALRLRADQVRTREQLGT